MTRDDKNLIALCCPHCGDVVPALRVDIPEFQRQQLVYMKCPNCHKGITKEQIDDTYREYFPSKNAQA